MRLLRGMFFGIAILIIALIIFMPLLTGKLFRHNYYSLIAFYNMQNNLHAEIIDYKEGWFNSDAKLKVEVNSAVMPITFVFDQHIQHGPIIFQHENFPSIFGLAAVYSKLESTPEAETILQNNDVLVSLAGNYFTYVKISPVQIKYGDKNIQIKINNLESKSWLFPRQSRIYGEANVSGLRIFKADGELTVPNIHVQLDLHRSESGLWLGESAVTLPEITLANTMGKTFSISGISFTGFADQLINALNGMRQLDIEKIKFDGETVGPIHLQASVHGLNAKAISDMINMYSEIESKGELYESQLQIKISSMLPTIILPGANLQLDAFDITTADGNFAMSGGAVWPETSTALPDDFPDILQIANARASLRVSGALANNLIHLIAKLSFTRQISDEDLQKLFDLQKKADVALQRNRLLIISLADIKNIPGNSAARLLQLQKDEMPEEYTATVKNLFLQREISPFVAHFLNWQYSQVQEQAQALKLQITNSRESIEQQMREQVNDWVRGGYITYDQHDYVVAVTWDDGKLKVNGQLVDMSN